ncbi:unnamed protein product [marine sediment metagenome]|uniref:Uncharacterized protein n=1 Tax=marine sediment metagenome TaxID=412755 RepID=X0X2K3_9ZZZZ
MRLSLVLTILISCLLFSGCMQTPISVVDEPLDVNITEPVDELSGAVMTIGFEHHETHEGDHYFIKTYITDNGGIGSTQYFAFTTQNHKRIHARTKIAPDVDYIMTIYEDGNITGGINGTEQNNDRDSDNTALLEAWLSPTINDLGTPIWTSRNGGGKNPTGVSPEFGYEIIAKTNSTYIFALEKQVAQDGVVDVDFWWYEH